MSKDKKKGKIETEEVRHIAELAKLKLSVEEIDLFRRQFNETLAYIDILNKLKTDKNTFLSVKKTDFRSLRPDKVNKCLSQKQALSNTRNKEKGYFKVKAVFQE